VLLFVHVDILSFISNTDFDLCSHFKIKPAFSSFSNILMKMAAKVKTL